MARRLVATLAATYPNGGVGYVTGLMSDQPSGLFNAPKGATSPDILSDIIDFLTSLYHNEIGPAYAPQDFTYTFHWVDTDYELYELIGQRILNARVPGTKRPGDGRGY
jgi:hypothetical protein